MSSDREDDLVVIARDLRPVEAGMLRGLLESAGITALLRDDALSSVHPFLAPVVGGAKLVVLKADEERAREIIQSAGAFPGSPADEPADIPEEEWSAPSAADAVGRPRERSARDGRAWRRGALVAFALAVVFVLLRCGAGA